MTRAKSKKKETAEPKDEKDQPKRQTGIPQVSTVATQCSKCGSSRRDKYSGVRIQEHAGTFEGKQYTHIVRRWTKCLDCGQARVDREYVNHPDVPIDEMEETYRLADSEEEKEG